MKKTKENQYIKYSIIMIVVIITICSLNYISYLIYPEAQPMDTSDLAITKTTASKFKHEIIDGTTYVDGVLIVNKKIPIAQTYNNGEDQVSKAKFEELIESAHKAGHIVIDTSYSGFRDYGNQKSLYDTYVAEHGLAEADKFSARPGHSEHQTGFAFDLQSIETSELLGASEQQSENERKAVEWVSKNAHKHGFIVRYQKGKEELTGYIAEPWHLRYIGYERAQSVYESGKCLEEYYEIEGGGYR